MVRFSTTYWLCKVLRGRGGGGVQSLSSCLSKIKSKTILPAMREGGRGANDLFRYLNTKNIKTHTNAQETKRGDVSAEMCTLASSIMLATVNGGASRQVAAAVAAPRFSLVWGQQNGGRREGELHPGCVGREPRGRDLSLPGCRLQSLTNSD